MLKDADDNQDSILVKNSFKILRKSLLKYKNYNMNIDYYFINDTVKINSKEEETIFIPNTFTKYTKRSIKGELHKFVFNGDSIYKTWKTSYDIKVNKNDTKQFLKIKGYKVKITETRVGDYDTYINISEIYMSDKYNFPFNYYEFLKLKKTINLSGLILECKTYLQENPYIYNIYSLQDLKKIEFDSLKLGVE